MMKNPRGIQTEVYYRSEEKIRDKKKGRDINKCKEI